MVSDAPPDAHFLVAGSPASASTDVKLHFFACRTTTWIWMLPPAAVSEAGVAVTLAIFTFERCGGVACADAVTAPPSNNVSESATTRRRLTRSMPSSVL
jgi:hypothetical protein